MKLFGKQLPAFALVALLVMASVGSAAVLTYFGQITGYVTVEKAVVLTGDDCSNGICAYSDTVSGGETAMTSTYTLTSQTSVPVLIELATSVTPNDDGITSAYTNIMTLDNKKPSTWIAIDDDTEATLKYNVVGDVFDYELAAMGVDNIEYALVYYPDSGATDPVDGKPWNIDNAVLVGTGIAAGNELAMSGQTDIGSLPYSEDYNANPNAGDSYCDGENGYDYYDHCSGAKIWLMPLTDYNAKSWNPTAWLFETDLIYYFDNVDNELTVPAGGIIEFGVDTAFAINLFGDYTIVTTALPVV